MPLRAVRVSAFPPFVPSIVVFKAIVLVVETTMVAGPPQLNVTSPPPASAASSRPLVQFVTLPAAFIACTPSISRIIGTSSANPIDKHARLFIVVTPGGALYTQCQNQFASEPIILPIKHQFHARPFA